MTKLRPWKICSGCGAPLTPEHSRLHALRRALKCLRHVEALIKAGCTHKGLIENTLNTTIWYLDQAKFDLGIEMEKAIACLKETDHE